MSKKYVISTLIGIFFCLAANLASAGDVGYRFRPSYFNLPAEGLPQSGKVFADAVVGRPVGLATTIAGTGIFIATLPMTVPSCSVREAGRQLVVRPGGWTFDRPLGKPSCYDERSLTKP